MCFWTHLGFLLLGGKKLKNCRETHPKKKHTQMDEEKKIMEIYYYHAANQRPINSTEKRVMLDFIGTGTCS